MNGVKCYTSGGQLDEFREHNFWSQFRREKCPLFIKWNSKVATLLNFSEKTKHPFSLFRGFLFLSIRIKPVSFNYFLVTLLWNIFQSSAHGQPRGHVNCQNVKKLWANCAYRIGGMRELRIQPAVKIRNYAFCSTLNWSVLTTHSDYVPIGGSTVVKALCYSSEGLWFDSRWCHWNFSLT